MVSWMALPEPQASLTMHSSLKNCLSSCLMLTCDVSFLPRPDHSQQMVGLGENTGSLKQIIGHDTFPNHTLCLDPSGIKLFSSSSQLLSEASPPPSHPALFMATCSSIQPYLFVSLQWALAKPLSFKALHWLASLFLVSSPSSSLHALFTFTPVPSHQTCQSSPSTLCTSSPCFFSCSFFLLQVPILHFCCFAFLLKVYNFPPFFYYRIYPSASEMCV